MNRNVARKAAISDLVTAIVIAIRDVAADARAFHQIRPKCVTTPFREIQPKTPTVI